MAGPRREGGERGGVDVCAGGEEGNRDGELAGDEEREVDETWWDLVSQSCTKITKYCRNR